MRRVIHDGKRCVPTVYTSLLLGGMDRFDRSDSENMYYIPKRLFNELL